MASELGGTSDQDALTRDSECSTITDESLEGGRCSELTVIKRRVPDLVDQMMRTSLSENREDRSTNTPEWWSELPSGVDSLILANLPFHDLFISRSVCKSFRDVLKRKTFQQERGRVFPFECSLSPLVLYVKNEKWHILGYEYKERKWRKLPPLEKPIPIPDKDLFKDFLVVGHGGLFCVNVGKPCDPENILVFNPMTGSTTVIPRMGFSRHPVVLHLRVALTKTDDTVSSRYWIVAVGSSATGTEDLSRKTEVYDSVKKRWEVAGDVPGTDFSVNEQQSGVYCESENVLLMTGFMFNGSKGVLAYDVGTGTWREDWLCPFPQSAETTHFAITQLVECSGVIYLFSEQEVGHAVTHCIDRLDLLRGGGFAWTRKVTRQRQANRALLVYPEYTCVPVREHKLCIFNTIERTGVVYNMSDDPINPDGCDNVPVTPPLEDGLIFHSLNPLGYAYEPSFGVSV